MYLALSEARTQGKSISQTHSPLDFVLPLGLVSRCKVYPFALPPSSPWGLFLAPLPRLERSPQMPLTPPILFSSLPHLGVSWGEYRRLLPATCQKAPSFSCRSLQRMSQGQKFSTPWACSSSKACSTEEATEEETREVAHARTLMCPWSHSVTKWIQDVGTPKSSSPPESGETIDVKRIQGHTTPFVVLYSRGKGFCTRIPRCVCRKLELQDKFISVQKFGKSHAHLWKCTLRNKGCTARISNFSTRFIF